MGEKRGAGAKNHILGKYIPPLGLGGAVPAPEPNPTQRAFHTSTGKPKKNRKMTFYNCPVKKIAKWLFIMGWWKKIAKWLFIMASWKKSQNDFL